MLPVTHAGVRTPAHQLRTLMIVSVVAAAPRAASGGVMTDLERRAVANGWSLDSFRWACARLRAPTSPVMRDLARTQPIPPAPDLHARVRRVRAAAAQRSRES